MPLLRIAVQLGAANEEAAGEARSAGRHREDDVDVEDCTPTCSSLIAAALWGFGNVAQKTVLEHLDPFSAVGLRRLIGGFLMLPLAGGKFS